MSRIHGLHQIIAGSIENTSIRTIVNGVYSGITDNKLDVISSAGKVLNSATTATADAVASAIVARNASGQIVVGSEEAATTYLKGVIPSLNGGTGVSNPLDATLTMDKALDFQISAPYAFTSSASSLVTLALPEVDGVLATQAYVDGVAQGLDLKQEVRLATKEAIADLSGLLVVDGVQTVAGDRVLVKDQADAKQNGIYVVAAGAWSRASDCNNTPTAEVTAGMYAYVMEGTLAGNGFVVISPNSATYTVAGVPAIELGVDSIQFAQFSGAGVITAYQGLVKSGNSIGMNNLIVNAGLETPEVGDHAYKFEYDTYGRIVSATAVSTLSELGVTGVAADITDLEESVVSISDVALYSVLDDVTDGASGADKVGLTAISEVSGSTVQAGMESLKANIGTLSSLATVAQDSTVLAINEIHGEMDALSAGVGTYSGLNTTSKIVVDAINEVHGELDTLSAGVGDYGSMTTTSKVVAGAINELDAEIGDLSGKSSLLSSTTLVGMVSEVANDVGDLSTLSGFDAGVDTVLEALNELRADLTTAEAVANNLVEFEFVGAAAASDIGDDLKTFETDFAYVAGTLKVFVNGLLYRSDLIDQTNAATKLFVFDVALQAEDEVVVSYHKDPKAV